MKIPPKKKLNLQNKGLTTMTSREISEIAEYVKDVREDLYNWGMDSVAMQSEHARLYKTIERILKIREIRK